MFHVELRMGMQYARKFNLDEAELWTRFLRPLLDDRDFICEGHDWEPRKTKIMVLDGPELRAHQLGLGRGWSNALRGATDVTDAVLVRARELYAGQRSARPAPAVAPPAATALRERLIGRLSAGPVTVEQITEMAESLMPDSDPSERLAACEQAVWGLLAGGDAQLAPNDR
jgi:hypothetical protein